MLGLLAYKAVIHIFFILFFKNLNGVDTKILNRAMKRNISRFPKQFCFQITADEYMASRCQTGTLNSKTGRGSNLKYLPYVYSEQGVAMLAGVLHSEIEINVVNQAIVEQKSETPYHRICSVKQWESASSEQGTWTDISGLQEPSQDGSCPITQSANSTSSTP